MIALRLLRTLALGKRKCPVVPESPMAVLGHNLVFVVDRSFVMTVMSSSLLGVLLFKLKLDVGVGKLYMLEI